MTRDSRLVTTRRHLLGLALCGVVLQLVSFGPLAAQKPEDEATKLAKATQRG